MIDTILFIAGIFLVLTIEVCLLFLIGDLEFPK